MKLFFWQKAKIPILGLLSSNTGFSGLYLSLGTHICVY